LLARIGQGDDVASEVLADHWAALGDPARCELIHVQRRAEPHARRIERELLARHARRWLAPAIAMGFPRDALELERGFLRAAPVIRADEAPDELFRLSPIVYREIGRADCNGQVFDAQRLTAAGAGDHVLLKAVHPMWAERIYDYDVLGPRDWNRGAMLGRAVRRQDRPLALVLPGGVHVSNLLGVRARADPEYPARPRGRALGVAVAISIAEGACRALSARGLVHPALTPENILIDARGEVRLVDLYPCPNLVDTFMPWSIEKAWHMSPEQAIGRDVDVASDVYTLALVACTLVGGEHPLLGTDNLFDRLQAMRDGRLALPQLPVEIDEVIRAALSPRERRFADPEAFRAALVAAATRAGIAYGPDVLVTAIRSGS